MTEIQQAVNPVSWSYLIEDKSLFYRFCMATEIPTPKLYGIFFRGTFGWSYNDSVVKKKFEWIRFLNEEIPSEFVIKPALGWYGKEIHIFSRNPQGFVDAFGKSCNASDILENMYSNSKFPCYIIQERLKTHPDLVRLSDTRHLQTIRMITYVNSYGEPHIFCAILKVITGESILDNFEWGATGNLMAEIGRNSTLKDAVAMQPGVPGISECHSDKAHVDA